MISGKTGGSQESREAGGSRESRGWGYALGTGKLYIQDV